MTKDGENEEAHIIILLGLYNGALFLQEQLESFATQTHQNWSLVISDDGSTDSGLLIAERFSKAHPSREIRIVEGPQQGFAQNFLSMLSYAEKADYFAFADQDDVWLPEKLARAVSQLPTPDVPAMICGRTIAVDRNLNKIAVSRLFKRKPCFGNALVQNLGAGNTMVVTNGALKFLLKGLPFAKKIQAHDWWVYQVLTGVGALIFYDSKPQILYRQHENNIIGSNRSTIGQFKRLRQLLNGRFAEWTEVTVSSLTAIECLLTPQSRRTLYFFRIARGRPLVSRVLLTYRAGIFRQTYLGNIALWLAVIIGRI